MYLPYRGSYYFDIFHSHMYFPNTQKRWTKHIPDIDDSLNNATSTSDSTASTSDIDIPATTWPPQLYIQLHKRTQTNEHRQTNTDETDNHFPITHDDPRTVRRKFTQPAAATLRSSSNQAWKNHSYTQTKRTTQTTFADTLQGQLQPFDSHLHTSPPVPHHILLCGFFSYAKN